MLIHIDYDFMGWNEYINAERANRFKASKIKRDEKELVMYTVRERYTGAYPVTLTIRPHYQHKKRDLDNFRMKGLIDGLVSAGVIENDNLTKIDKIILTPIFDGGTGVDVEIQPSNTNNALADFVATLTSAEKQILINYLKGSKNG